MAIREIENIVIPGYSQYALYAFDYTPGFADSPGVVEAEFLNHTGVYPSTNVYVHSYFPIYVRSQAGTQMTLGQFTLVSSEVQETGKYKSLRVKFMDKSVELDRYLVALRGQVGYDTTAYNALPAKEKSRVIGAVGSGGRVIWVGTSANECKENILGAQSGVDPCDPCPEKLTDPMLRQLDCEKYYLHNKRIYRYTFSEFLAAASSAMGISMSSVAASSTLKFEYVGTVREVLSNICAELGLAFFYDPSINQVVFIDVKVGININVKTIESEANKCKILDKSVRRSRENTKDVWGVAGFSRESEERRYGCGLNSCKKLRMAPFTLTDILEEPGHFKEDSGLPGFKRLEFYSTLHHRLGKEFRDLFVWLQEYKFKIPSNVEERVDEKLYKLNGMTIKKVFHPASEDFKSKFMYYLLMANITSKNFDSIVENAEKKKTYFFLAEIDETYEQKISNFEMSIAQNFLGRYWIRYYKENWAGLSYQTISPDGSIQYYDFKQPINLPFADMIYEAYGTLKGSPLLDRDGFDNIASGGPGNMVTRDTFFLMDRPASFWPVSFEDETLKNVEKNVRDYLFKEFSAPTDLTNKFKDYLGIEDYDPNTYRLYKVDYSAEDLKFDLDISDGDRHPAEEDNVTINTNACNKYTSYGLRDADSRKFDIKMGDLSLSLYMPVQSYVRTGDHSGYIILVERGGIDATYVIPKAEVFASGAIPSSSSASLGIELNYYNASESDLTLLARSTGEAYCDMNLSGISNLLNTVKGNLSHFVRPTEERSYTIEGFPVDFYTPRDGLKSFSVTAGSNGLKTSLTFSNSSPFKLSIDSVLKRIQHTRLATLNKPFPSGTWNKTNLNDLPEID